MYVCEQLAQSRYLMVEQSGVEPAASQLQVLHLDHYTRKP